MPQITPTVPPSEAKPQSHLPWLDSLRGLAALYVVIHHIGLACIPKGQEVQSTLAKLLIYPFAYGHYAVGVFIVLSGFSLMLPVTRSGTLRGSALDFYWRRAKRIIPPYYLSIIFSLVIDYFVTIPDGNNLFVTPVTQSEFIAHLILLQDVFGNLKINYVYWSIAVEWRIYLIFPLLIRLLKRVRLLVFVVLMTCIAAAIHFVTNYTIYSKAMPSFLALFCFGMVASEIAFSQNETLKKAREWRHWGLACVVSIIVFAVVQIGLGKYHSQSNAFIRDMIPGIFTSLLLIVASKEGSTASKILSFRPLAFLGMFAYSIYLTHAPTLAVIYVLLIKPLNFAELPSLLLMTLVCIPTVLLVAYLFFLLCERPFLNTKPIVPKPQT